MKQITGIGANVCDTLYTVSEYPKEDTKLKAENIMQSGGGPCATGLVAASRLGANCAYIGVLTDDPQGKFLMEDLEKYGVSTDYVTVKSGHTSFSSCIWLNTATASRTCVFHRGNIPPLALNDKQRQAIGDSAVLMVDGNELEAAIDGAKTAKSAGVKVLYDAGGMYEGVERLLPYADILIPSEEFALGHTGEKCALAAAKALFEKYSPRVVVITQGKKGGIMYDGEAVREYPAFLVDAVDSNGSGDVFHGAFAFCTASGYDYYKSCIFSSAVSAIKCTRMGARCAAPEFEEVVEFLKERGVNEL